MNIKFRRKIKRLVVYVLAFEGLRYRLWRLRNFSTTPCPHDGVYISSRPDRYGANSTPWLNALVLARVTGQPLYHHCSINCYRYRDSVIHRMLIENSQQSEHCPRCDLHEKAGWLYGQHAALMRHTHGKPLPDVIAESPLKETLFAYYRNAAHEKSWRPPVDPQSLLAVHVRMDDLRYRSKPDKQSFIGETELCELIRKLHDRYPRHHIHLITSPNASDIRTCDAVIDRSGVACSVSGSEDIDFDLYVMMCSDILILSRSTFGFIAALLHQGSAVYSYTNWTHFAELVGPYSPDGENANVSRYLKVLE